MLIRAISDADSVAVGRMLVEHSELVHDRASNGATRQSAQDYFLEGIETYVFEGDTALHVAAAAYDESVAVQLLGYGATVHASNRPRPATSALCCGRSAGLTEMESSITVSANPCAC